MNTMWRRYTFDIPQKITIMHRGFAFPLSIFSKDKKMNIHSCKFTQTFLKPLAGVKIMTLNIINSFIRGQENFGLDYIIA